jgi:hypothetical protein
LGRFGTALLPIVIMKLHTYIFCATNNTSLSFHSEKGTAACWHCRERLLNTKVTNGQPTKGMRVHPSMTPQMRREKKLLHIIGKPS